MEIARRARSDVTSKAARKSDRRLPKTPPLIVAMHVRQPALHAVVPEAVEAGEVQEEVRLSAASVHPDFSERKARQTD